MRLIDADQIHHAKYHGIAEIYPSDVNIESYKRGWNDALDAVADHSCFPSIDAVPVVRCKDCKWYGRVDKRRFYRGSDCLQKRIDTIVPERDFCSRGERKES